MATGTHLLFWRRAFEVTDYLGDGLAVNVNMSISKDGVPWKNGAIHVRVGGGETVFV